MYLFHIIVKDTRIMHQQLVQSYEKEKYFWSLYAYITG
jgi:hypothetical protein